MRVLITGGSGRLGSHVARDLMAHGHSVVNADRRAPIDPPAQSAGVSYRFVETEIGDVGQVAGAMTGCDAVVHLAAIPWPYSHPDELVFANSQLTFAVLHAASLLGVRKVVLASSLATLGTAFATHRFFLAYAPVDEAHPLRPQDPYGLNKEVDERTGEMFHRRTGMSVLAFRFHWVTLLEEARTAAKNQARAPERSAHVLWGYVDVRDAATACRLEVEADGLGYEVFVISAADTLCSTPTEEMLRRHAPEVQVRSSIPGFTSVFSIEKARRMLAFEPRYSWRNIGVT